MAKKYETLKMSVTEYIGYHKETAGKLLDRHEVYAMIKEGKLKAEKNSRNAWVITIKKEIPSSKEYTVKEFVEAYNKAHNLDTVLTVKEVRELASKGKIKAEKVSGKWVIKDNPGNLLNNEEEYIDENEALDIMRSLPYESIVSLIIDSIFSFNNLRFLNVVNIERLNNINLLVAPSLVDQYILIDVIISCLRKINIANKDIERVIDGVIDRYNNTTLSRINSNDLNFYNLLSRQEEVKDITFLSTFCVATIQNKLNDDYRMMTNEELYMFKVQMFVYAAIWFDMDEYLKYLYYLYR